MIRVNGKRLILAKKEYADKSAAPKQRQDKID